MISSYIYGGESYIRGESGNLTRKMADKIESFGGEVLLLSEITGIHAEGDRIVSVTTKKGDTYEAKEFLFSGDPINTFSLIDNSIASDYIKDTLSKKGQKAHR